MSDVGSHNPNVEQEIVNLVEEYRDSCLWFMRPEFIPKSKAEQQLVLDLILRHGDRIAYRRVMEIRKKWL